MQSVGVYFSSLQPNATSPSSKLLAHVSRRFPQQEHRPYHVEHRLFVDTSSQLPGSDLSQRAYTQLLTHSSTPSKTYVGSTKSTSPTSTALITIPHASIDGLTGLLVTKLQPQWFPRQSVAVEGGTSISLKDSEFNLCIGDVRVSGRSQPGSGTLRGLLIELRHFEDHDSTSDEYTETDLKHDQQAFGAMLNALFKDAKESFDESKIHTCRCPASRKGFREASTEEPEWELAKLYMEVFRGGRS